MSGKLNGSTTDLAAVDRVVLDSFDQIVSSLLAQGLVEDAAAAYGHVGRVLARVQSEPSTNKDRDIVVEQKNNNSQGETPEQRTSRSSAATTAAATGLVPLDVDHAAALFSADPRESRQSALVKAVDPAVESMSLEEYSAGLVSELQLIGSTDIQTAATQFTVPQWLLGLPVSGPLVGLQYTQAIVTTLWLRLQRHCRILVACSTGQGRKAAEARAFMAATHSKVSVSIQKRLNVAEDDPRVEEEVRKIMEGHRLRCQVEKSTEWVRKLHQRRLPVRRVVDMLMALFVYAVDMKHCPCATLDECDGKGKHRTKPEPPQHSDLQGRRLEAWSVANWVMRVCGEGRDLSNEQRAVVQGTLALMLPFVDLADQILEALPHCGMRVVFRGVCVRLAAQYRLDTPVVMHPFTSTSLEGEEALSFLDPTKPGTFFVLRLHSASYIDFMSVYPEQAEALLGRDSKFLVKSKMSRTVLRMLRCQFDIVTLVETGADASDDEVVESLFRMAQQTAFVYRHYLSTVVEARVLTTECQVSISSESFEFKESAFKLLDTVEKWLDSGQTRHSVIVGTAGGGKTSATLMTLSHVIKQGGFALFVPLPSVADPFENGALDRHVLAVLDVTRSAFAALCRQPKPVLILFDSLDECPSVPAGAVKSGLLSKNPICSEARVIISTRTELLKALRIDDERVVAMGNDRASVWTVAPFGPDDIEAMIDNRVKGKMDHLETAKLRDRVYGSPYSVRSHPMLLSMLLEIPPDELVGSPDRHVVYDVYVKRMLQAGKVEHLFDGVCKLGEHLLLSKSWHCSVGVARQALNCDAVALEALPVRVEDPHDDASVFSFAHRTIAEYAAAVGLSNDPRNIAAKVGELPAIVKRGALFFLLESARDMKLISAAVHQLLYSCRDAQSVIPVLEARVHDESLDKVTLANMCHDLGVAHGVVGDNNKQKEFLEKALRLKEEHCGKDHVSLAPTLASLGNAHGVAGNSATKKGLLERALQLKEKQYGPDHLELASTLVNLGTAHGALGDNKKKKECLERALHLQERHDAKDKVMLAVTLTNLGNAYGTLGEYDKQREHLERALVLSEKHYGKEHVELAVTLTNLGSAYGALGDSKKQIDVLERALKLREKHYGKNRVELAVTLISLGNAHGSLGDQGKKKEMMERALKLQEKQYGKDHVKLVPAIVNLASATGSLGDNDSKRKMLERALVIQETKYGPSHSELAPTLNSLSNAYGALGDATKKNELRRRALQLQKK